MSKDKGTLGEVMGIETTGDSYFTKCGKIFANKMIAHYMQRQIRVSKHFKFRKFKGKQKSGNTAPKRILPPTPKKARSFKNTMKIYFSRKYIPKVAKYFNEHIGEEITVFKAFKNPLSSPPTPLQMINSSIPWESLPKIPKGTKMRIVSVEVFDGFATSAIEDVIMVEYKQKDGGGVKNERIYASTLYSHTIERLNLHKPMSHKRQKVVGGKKGRIKARLSIAMREKFKEPYLSTFSPLLDIKLDAPKEKAEE